MTSDPHDSKSISARARARRVKIFASLIETLYSAGHFSDEIKILDIGGTIEYWKTNAQYMPKELIKKIEVVNLPPADANTEIIDEVCIEKYAGNALDVSTLHSNKYDIIHSNSVIEHVGNLHSQKIFANNINQLAPFHFIQTPCLTFPLEPHFYIPFFGLLPLSFRTFLHQNLHLGFMGREKDWLQARINCEETRLLTRKEIRYLFAKSECIPERMLLMTKSWMITNMIR